MNNQRVTVEAGADLEQGQVVKLDGDRNAIPATAKADLVFGVVEDSCEKGDLVAVNVLGQCLIKVNGSDTAIEPGDVLECGAKGQAVKETTGARRVFAEAMEGATEDGQLIYGLVGRVFEDRA